MTTRTVKTLRRLFLAAVLSVAAETAATSIPESKITALESALTDKSKSTSPARRRLTLKRLIRAGEALLKTHTTASNRYAVLGILFRGRQELHGLNKSTVNREALLEVCRQLVDAPDAYADIRLDAELLLSQVELARKGASPSKRAEALRALMGRYRDTPAETKLFRIATLMALEIGDDGLLAELRRAISERASNDLEMIEFLRDHLGGQIFGAPFCGTFKRAGGTTFSFPIDRIGWSTVFLFWSKENEQLEERLAKWQELKDNLPSMFRIFSFNVDELPDAGESILRKMKADWPAMHLPGGRTSLTYRAYARTDPVGVHVSPSGYAAMIMPGLHRDDYPRRVQSYLKKDTRYLSQLRSLFIGEFLAVDPIKPFDPGTPPECKTYTTATSGTTAKLNRTADGVPVKTLAAIQACFVTPPFRYRLSHEEELGNYKKAEALCSRTIQQHPDAPNLWIVHNRRIIALLGLWKIACDPKHLEGAVREANACLALKPPPGADIVPRFCLAKEGLRHKGASPKAIIGKFIEAAGGKQAPGSALAAASILALDAGARALHEQIRRTILDHHTENPMMWTVVSFLLNRYHRYYLYSAPYYRGWSFGRRRQAYFSNGQPEDANRVLRAGLKTLEGETFRMPRDTVGKWTVILFTVPWEDGGAFPDKRFLSDVTGFAQARDPQDINLVVAFLSDDKERAAALMKDNASDCRTMVVPGGMRNQMVQRLGILAEDKSLNVTVLRPDGTIALALSGLAKGSYKGGGLIRNIIAWDEEKEVNLALEDGDLEKARRLAFKRAPIEEPTSHDPKKGKKRRPLINLHHLRSRAKVYMALKDWKAALADMEQVVDRKTREDAHMSMKTAELREAIRLRSVIRKELGQPEEDK
jgi:hypothetical protein